MTPEQVLAEALEQRELDITTYYPDPHGGTLTMPEAASAIIAALLAHPQRHILAAALLDPERLADALRATSACGPSCDHDGVEWLWTNPDTFAAAILDVLRAEP